MKDRKRWIYVISFTGLAGRFHCIVDAETTLSGYSNSGRSMGFAADENLIAQFRRRIPPDYPVKPKTINR